MLFNVNMCYLMLLNVNMCYIMLICVILLLYNVI